LDVDTKLSENLQVRVKVKFIVFCPEYWILPGSMITMYRTLIKVFISCFASIKIRLKAALYSMLSFQGCRWRRCTRSYLKAASTHCWRQRHSVTALATYAMTLFAAWMPWRRNVDLLVPAGTSTRLNWIQCGFNHLKTEGILRKFQKVT
jgi:transposase